MGFEKFKAPGKRIQPWASLRVSIMNTRGEATGMLHLGFIKICSIYHLELSFAIGTVG